MKIGRGQKGDNFFTEFIYRFLRVVSCAIIVMDVLLILLKTRRMHANKKFRAY